MIGNENSIVEHVIQIKKWNNKICQCECKNYNMCKKYYSWNTNTCICENSKYLKGFADTSVTEFGEIVIVMNNLSTKNQNTITANVTSTASINCHSKKLRDCYILHIVLLITIKLFIAISICCYQINKMFYLLPIS